jgi:hypothetical protein
MHRHLTALSACAAGLWLLIAAFGLPGRLTAQDDGRLAEEGPDPHADERSTQERIRLGAAPEVPADLAAAFAETTRMAAEAGAREVELRRAQELAPFDLSWGLP